MTPRGRLQRFAGELGASGVAALALLGGALLFVVAVLNPLEARNAQLGRELAKVARQAPSATAGLAASAESGNLDGFYRYFDTGRDTTDWLATLYGIGKTIGLELGAGDYRLRDAGDRLERYEITLPLAGSYSQVRAFAKNALLEIPVLALDQVSIRRERASDGVARAEVRFTLYLPKP